MGASGPSPAVAPPQSDLERRLVSEDDAPHPAPASYLAVGVDGCVVYADGGSALSVWTVFPRSARYATSP